MKGHFSIKSTLVGALGAFVLGWFTNPALAQELEPIVPQLPDPRDVLEQVERSSQEPTLQLLSGQNKAATKLPPSRTETQIPKAATLPGIDSPEAPSSAVPNEQIPVTSTANTPQDQTPGQKTPKTIMPRAADTPPGQQPGTINPGQTPTGGIPQGHGSVSGHQSLDPKAQGELAINSPNCATGDRGVGAPVSVVEMGAYNQHCGQSCGCTGTDCAPAMNSACMTGNVDYFDGAGAAYNRPVSNRPRLYAYAGFYLLIPTWEGNAAFNRIQTNTTTLGGVTTTNVNTNQRDFDYGFSGAPRLSLGAEIANGLGIRVSWYRFDQSAGIGANIQSGNTGVTVNDATGFINAKAGTLMGMQQHVLDFTSDLELNVYDIDVTQRIFENAYWDVLVGGGIRGAHLSQDYAAWHHVSNLPGNTKFAEVVSTSNTFNGAGPNLYWDGRRKFKGTGLAAYNYVRGGLLYGSSSQTNFSRRATGANGNTVRFQSTEATRDDIMPFLEAELGFEWSGQSSNGPVPFVRAGVTTHSWFGAGNGWSTGGNNYDNLGLFGLNFLVGADF